ncbi:response regulator RpfG family c-di-GMP phosphodiesterase [Desulfobaculum xiamenense]|uniref:Response regulator RpfG family c-di-GMP phosphodiesterase n=1 Tax=Desulfobaculum xiamenense TaxID=995050 RepID=A0A846QKQ8_9BACT|nr:HD domain-containing phosphohydrolase [Desulfobaculum xiamenense]NJB68711.1 response regulator RpfG family c-di-GMP phosphodiesterase [Desulfobaculum xiamenense]
MNRQTILLVDDETGIIDVHREVLEGDDYRVITAKNGREALDILCADAVDLVVSDVRMPLLDGYGMLDGMRERGIDSDVIFLTGYGTIANAVECLHHGACDYLEKPFDIFRLRDKIVSALDARTLRRAGTDGPLALERVRRLREALAGQQRYRDIIGAFLQHVRDTFAPDGMALFMPEGDGLGAEPRVVWGNLLREENGWFEAATPVLCAGDEPRLLRSGDSDAPGCPEDISAMCAGLAVGQGRGRVIVLRRGAARGYTPQNLNLLAFFATHASAAFEALSISRRMQEMNLEIVTSHVASVEAKDVYTRGHSERVGQYAALVGRELGLCDHDVELLRLAGILHDVGKIGVPDGILKKPGRLTEEEFALMRRHPAMGRDIVSKVSSLVELVPIIYHHHERVDGTGYPDGLVGESIPLLARVMSVVDGFEAMTSDRAYQKARTVEQASAILRENAGRQWDARVVDAWLSVVDKGFLFLPN